jgi:5-methylcytosine-specific restriction enzyme subunit McrC
MGIRLFEHKSFVVSTALLDEGNSASGEFGLNELAFGQFQGIQSRSFGNGNNCYTVVSEPGYHIIKAEYCIGLDWLGKYGRFIYVEPKVNRNSGKRFDTLLDESDNRDSEMEETANTIPLTDTCELDYLRMLLDVLSDVDCAKKTTGLVQIDWEAAKIKIKSKDDRLTPFLIIQFLNLLKCIVKKGLKKAYYKQKDSLDCKFKGKVLIAQNVKHNVFKNRLTKTLCEFQVFGEDHAENKFLHKVFYFVNSFVQNNPNLFAGNISHIDKLVSYCRPAFENIGRNVSDHKIDDLKNNPFFNEYRPALSMGLQILKRFAFNITQTVQREIFTPPFWIDMPRLFELYVYQKLLQANASHRNKITYQFSTYGNALDILIKDGAKSMVIDTKYKLHYQFGQIHTDMRQVAGYARLTKVLDEVSKGNDGFNINAVLPCLIIYPDLEDGIAINENAASSLEISMLIDDSRKIRAYHKIYKLGVKLPLIDGVAND